MSVFRCGHGLHSDLTSVIPREHQRSTTVRATFMMLPRDISQSTICVLANR